MSKYFIEKKEEKILLSKYLEELQKEKEVCEKQSTYFGKNETIGDIKQIIKYIGDVELPKSVIHELCRQFHSFGGRYDVRGEKETIQRIYQIHLLYPELSAQALSHILFIYIKDLFDEYSLVELLGKFIKTMGPKDETFEIYYEYVDRKGEQLQKKYKCIAAKLDKYKKEYGEKYIDYLKTLIIRRHDDIEKIISSMPSSEIIRTDEQQLLELSQKFRIFFGVGYPTSYIMTKYLVEQDDLSMFDEQPSYYISTSDKRVNTTFTKQDFLDSLKKDKVKKL